MFVSIPNYVPIYYGEQTQKCIRLLKTELIYLQSSIFHGFLKSVSRYKNAQKEVSNPNLVSGLIKLIKFLSVIVNSKIGQIYY